MPLDVGAAGPPDEIAAEAVRFVPRGARILDLSQAKGRVAAQLPEGCVLVERATDADYIVALGLVDGPAGAAEVLRRLREYNRPVIVDLPDAPGGDRVTRRQLSDLLAASAFGRARLQAMPGGLVIRLEPKGRLVRPEREVWVLSYSNVGNFGDRLGWHVLSQVLPPHARVRRIYHQPWALPEGEPDLLVLGIGNSLFQPLLTDELIALMDRAKSRIGVFGTQYRSTLDAHRLGAVLDRLDVWWARHEADAYLYGRGRQNVRHLGDWLIDAFPLAKPTIDELLIIGDEVWGDQPLDRTIERIQAYTQVRSNRLHPLLCALTSAEAVAYSEQRDHGAPGEASGKFRSMLLDIFGHEKPEDQLWRVDAVAVAEYKAKVRANVAALARDLERLAA